MYVAAYVSTLENSWTIYIYVNIGAMKGAS